MEMFLMVVCLSLFGLAVTAAAFGVATESERREQEAGRRPVEAKEVMPARFFADDTALPAIPPQRIPLEALLLQIDHHVRLEQAAAESFLRVPTPQLLHSRTVSPLVH